MGREQANRDEARLAGSAGRGERQGTMRAAGVAAARVAAPIVAGQGGVVARLKAEWAAVAGPDVAPMAWPERLGRDGALKLRVVPTAALDLQHRAPLLIARLNTFFGREVVARLVLVQGAVPAPSAAPPRAGARLGTADAAALEARLGSVGDPALREALAGLGALVLTAGRGEG